MSSDFWAVTAYFNPLRWRSRRANYELFRQRLDLPLLTVEWSPGGDFELGEGDADHLVQVSGGDLLWQKERLLNLGLAHLPRSCALVAWLDADILFRQADWPAAARALLQEKPVVQLFSRASHLRPGTPDPLRGEGILRCDEGILAAWSSTGSPCRFLDGLIARVEAEFLRDAPPGPPLAYGFAWAARRKWLDEIGGLYDRCIIGGADTLLFYALVDRLDDLMASYSRSGVPRTSGSLLRWQERVRAAGSGVAHLEGEVLHLFHGDLGDRQYRQRHRQLARTGIDVDRHLMAGSGAAWRLDASTPAETRRLLESYFRLRREDGDACP